MGQGHVPCRVSRRQVHGNRILPLRYIIPEIRAVLGKLEIAAKPGLLNTEGPVFPPAGVENVISRIIHVAQGDAPCLPEVLLPALRRRGNLAKVMVILFVVAFLIILGVVPVGGFHVIVLAVFQCHVVARIFPGRPAEGELFPPGLLVEPANLIPAPVILRGFPGVPVYRQGGGRLFLVQPGLGIGEQVVRFGLLPDFPLQLRVVAGP